MKQLPGIERMNGPWQTSPDCLVANEKCPPFSHWEPHPGSEPSKRDRGMAIYRNCSTLFVVREDTCSTEQQSEDVGVAHLKK